MKKKDFLIYSTKIIILLILVSFYFNDPANKIEYLKMLTGAIITFILEETKKQAGKNKDLEDLTPDPVKITDPPPPPLPPTN